MRDRLFDTHAHLISDDWNRYPPRALQAQLPVPKRTDYTVTAEALTAMMDEHAVPTACVVQRGHLYGHDNGYIIDAAEKYPGRLLPVVMLDTQDPATPARFTDMVKHHRVRGFRMAQLRPQNLDTAWMSSPAALEIWKCCAQLGTPMTLIFFHNQLPWTLPLLGAIAGMFPDLPILVDHLGTAYGMTAVEAAWAGRNIRDIPMPAAPDYGLDDILRIFENRPNVHFKLTEVNLTRMDEAGVDAARVLRRMADGFGAGRLVWGSDIGQSLRWSYAQKAAMARAAAALLDEHERALFLHDNAARIYRA